MNPSLASSTISEHLSKLATAGVLDVEKVSADGRDADAPTSFYYLTDAAREVFDTNGIFSEDGYKSLYSQVELPDDIQAHRDAERPPVDAATVSSE